MRIFAAFVLVVCVVTTSLAADSTTPRELDTIVIGKGIAGARHGDESAASTSVCMQNPAAIQEPYAHWRALVLQSLCNAKDSDSLLAAHLLTVTGLVGGGDVDAIALERARAAGKANPRVLWLVAVTSNCNLPFDGSQCERRLSAALALTQADPDNALAWLTLAYVSDAGFGDPAQIKTALGRAAKAPRVHDYGFDLLKLAVAATGKRPIPEAARSMRLDVRESVEQTRLQSVGPVSLVTHFVTDWLRGGCNSHPNKSASDSPIPDLAERCRSANELLKRGDSMLTLGAESEMRHALESSLARANIAAQTPDGAKAMIAAYSSATSESDFAARFDARSLTQ